MSNIEHPMLLRVPPDLASVLRDSCRGSSNRNSSPNTVPIIGIDMHTDNETFTLQIGTHHPNDSSSSSSSSSLSSSITNDDSADDTSSVRHLKGTIAHTTTYMDASKPFSTDTIAQAHSVSRILIVQEHYDSAEPVSASTVPNPSYYQTTRDPTPGSQLKVATSGITPPLRDIVRKQHVPSWKYISRYSTDEIMETERTLVDLIQNTDAPKYEHVVEELVDAEAFMAGWFRGEGATDNATLIYENGILQDIYSMDKGKLNKRRGTGALLRLPNTSSSSSGSTHAATGNKGPSTGLILSLRTSSTAGGGSGTGSTASSSLPSNITGGGTVTDADVQALMNAYSEGDLILGGLNDDDDDDDDGDYYNDDDEDEGVNEGLDDEENLATSNLNLLSSSSSSSSSANIQHSNIIESNEEQRALQPVNEELDLVDSTVEGEEGPSSDLMIMEETSILPTPEEEEVQVTVDPRIQITEDALQRAKEELAMAQKSLNTGIAVFRARQANTVSRVQAEVDRLEKELLDLKGLAT